jgi:hypothetical protein
MGSPRRRHEDRGERARKSGGLRASGIDQEGRRALEDSRRDGHYERGLRRDQGSRRLRGRIGARENDTKTLAEGAHAWQRLNAIELYVDGRTRDGSHRLRKRLPPDVRRRPATQITQDRRFGSCGRRE